MPTLFRVEKRGSEWVVLPESGNKVLGTHKTKEDAEAQLAAIESSKAAAQKHSFSPGDGGLHDAGVIQVMARVGSCRIFSVNAWRFAVSVGTGKWDRFTSYGTKIKDGEESVFDEKNLGQMIDNFASRKNDLAMCFDHQSAFVEQNGQPAPALAFYNALALIIDGKVAKFATHDPAVQPPDPTGLENGVYGFRSELTPLGEKLLPNYRYLSPLFTDQGADEQGNPIGYDLMDVAATNTPFQDGVGLTFHRFGAAEAPPTNRKERFSMDPKLMEKYGLKEGYSENDLHDAMKKFAEDAEKKIADADEKMKKFDAADGDPDGDGDKDTKMADEDKDAAERMAKDLGLEPGAKLSKVYAAFSAKTVPMAKLAETEKRLAKLEEERKAEKQAALESQYAELADRGIAYGYSKEKRNDLIAFARADFKAAQSFVSDLPGAKVMTRLTSGGKPLDVPRAEGSPVRMAKMQGVSIPVRGATFAEKAKAYAKEHKVDLATAQREVVRTDPAAASDYLDQ